MIKEAIEKIVEMSEPNYHEAPNGRVYTDKELRLIKEPSPTPILINTLTGLVDYVKENRDFLDFPDLIIHIVDHKSVELISSLKKPHMNREGYAASSTREFINDFPFGSFLSPESFIIKLQTNFVGIANEDNNDIEKILTLASKVTDEKSLTLEDDGVSQSVVIKSGIAMTEPIKVPNPVCLAPYRTFREVEQPASLFIFRTRTGQEGKLPTFALFETDGSQWKLTAIQRIKEYLGKEITGIPIIA